MEFCAVDETERVPDGTMRGSMAVSYDDAPIRVHAVQVATDGSVKDRAVCGFPYSKGRLGDVLRDWQTVTSTMCCKECGNLLGDARIVALGR